ncbi:uncharacterized protein [Rutidosis leptorrhynchoides]|uniref:uncharacterized protein isoform X2 n=1 Tax=Rutidosis leptorrhynchoides TaxID=125765 RepID=UPI003A99D834
MKRELAFALEARSEFSCFVGRTRSSKGSPDQVTDTKRRITRSAANSPVKLSDKVSVNRRNKRIKTEIPDVHSVSVEKSAVEKAVNAGDEAAVDVVIAGEESAAAEVGNDGEESTVAKVANAGVGSVVEEVVNADDEAAVDVVIAGEESVAAEVGNDGEESTVAKVANAGVGSVVEEVVNAGDEAAVDVVIAGEESAAVERVNDGEESTVAEVANAGVGSVVAEENNVTKGSMAAEVLEIVNGGEGLVVEKEKEKEKEKNVKRKKRKNQVNGDTPKRFTRSSMKEKEDNVEELETPTMKKLELKMSKKIGLERMPINSRELLDTGLLEGFRVYYKLDNEGGSNLQGLIKGAGILCSCNLCNGIKVIPISQFELHARKSYRHAIKFIYLENGKSLLELIALCKAGELERLEVALQTVISSLPVKGPFLCTNCNSSIEPSTENLLICESCLDKKQVQAELTATTHEEDRISSPVSEAFTSNTLSISSVKKKKKRRGRPRKISTPVTDAVTSNAFSLLPCKKSGKGRKRKSSNTVATSSKGSMKDELSPLKSKSKIVKRSSRSTDNATTRTSSQKKSGKKPTIKNLQLHSAVFEEGGLPDGTELTYVSHGEKLLEGYKKGRGIFCSCCQTEVSASLFEAHAGWASRRKPYENIYISNGVSLHEYSVSLKMNENRRLSVKSNDDACRICWDGGELMLCDGCPRSFHKECVDLDSIPHGKWYCKYCQQAMKLVADNDNAVAAGRVTGIDPIEQIMSRCIRIVKNPENTEFVACVLCRCQDFSKKVFNDRTVIVCDQCEREYHIGCLRDNNMADIKALPKGKWFCCTDCERIYSDLANLLTQEPKLLPDDLLTSLREKQKDNGADNVVNSEMRFVLLSGKNASRDTRKLLAQAVDIFHECFDPIIDATSGRDFIPSMVYGRKIWSQDFAGMLCAILTIESNVVSVGMFRVFGEDIAELPLVATSKCNQGKGYFNLLFTCIENLLTSMKVKKIVLPAAEEAKSIWTNKFGFETIAPPELAELKQTCSGMMTFKGTFMLQKDIPQAQNEVTNAGDDIIKNPSVE